MAIPLKKGEEVLPGEFERAAKENWGREF